VTFVYLFFVVAALVVIECLIGGTRLLYSLPAYGLISLGAILSVAGIRAKRIPPDPFCVGSALLLGAWVLARAWRSPIEYLALPDFFMMIACLMVYLLTAFYLTGLAERAALIVVLWAVAALDVWVAMVQFGKDPNFMLFGLLRPPNVIRASGMYISPNNFAGFLITVAMLSISFGLWSRWRVWAKVLSFYVAVFCLAGVAISGSRGGYLAAIGSLVCLAVGSIYAIGVVDRRKFYPALLGALVSLVVLIGLAAFLMAHSQLLARRMQSMVVKDVRIFNWGAAIDHIRVSPWVGTGAGTHLIFGRLFRRPQIQADPVHAHCDYLELLAEYGIAGGFCMALFVAAHLHRALRSFSWILRQRLLPSGFYRSDGFAIQLGAICAVVGLAIHSVFDFDLHIPGIALVFAFLFGVFANPGLERSLGFVDRRLTPLAKLLPPVLGLFMLWRGMPLLPSEYCAETARCALRDDHFVDAIHYATLGIGPVKAPAQQPDLLNLLLRKAGPNPNNPDLYYYLGEANRALGVRFKNQFMSHSFYDAAAAAFEPGLKVFPEYETMLVRYAQTLDALHRFADAEAVYQKALAADPNLAVLYDYYEAHLTAEGSKTEADALHRQRLNAPPVFVDPGQKLDILLK